MKDRSLAPFALGLLMVAEERITDQVLEARRLLYSAIPLDPGLSRLVQVWPPPSSPPQVLTVSYLGSRHSVGNVFSAHSSGGSQGANGRFLDSCR
jgi:hypothetical protein